MFSHLALESSINAVRPRNVMNNFQLAESWARVTTCYPMMDLHRNPELVPLQIMMTRTGHVPVKRN